MAGVTSAVIGVGLSAYQTVDAINQKEEAQKAINEYRPQELVNAQKYVQLDTNSADRQTRANQVTTASSIDALQRTGARGVLAGLPQVANQSMLLQNLIEEDLSKQRQERDVRIAIGEERIQGIQEVRDRETLAGLGQQLNVANQNIVNGVTGVVQSGLAVANSVKSDKISQAQQDKLDTETKLYEAKRNSILSGIDNSLKSNNSLPIGSNKYIN